jgi:hypothetical protein
MVRTAMTGEAAITSSMRIMGLLLRATGMSLGVLGFSAADISDLLDP